MYEVILCSLISGVTRDNNMHINLLKSYNIWSAVQFISFSFSLCVLHSEISFLEINFTKTTRLMYTKRIYKRYMQLFLDIIFKPKISYHVSFHIFMDIIYRFNS